jgi:hypothetical protein
VPFLTVLKVFNSPSASGAPGETVATSKTLGKVAFLETLSGKPAPVISERGDFFLVCLTRETFNRQRTNRQRSGAWAFAPIRKIENKQLVHLVDGTYDLTLNTGDGAGDRDVRSIPAGEPKTDGGLLVMTPRHKNQMYWICPNEMRPELLQRYNARALIVDLSNNFPQDLAAFMQGGVLAPTEEA